MKKELQAIIAIAYRDLLKFLRDKPRIMATFAFPLIFILIMGGSMDANLSSSIGFNLLEFVFTGIFAQTLFQSTASGVISLIEDRENDFSQEIFVSPISRYSIIIGKILGETSVSMAQGLVILLLGFFLGINLTITTVLLLLPVSLIVCFLGGAFGLMIMANLSNQRTANQIFPFLLFPQFFLAGVFTPMGNLPIHLLVLSRIAPMTYAVDFIRNFYYLGSLAAPKVLLHPMLLNLGIILAMSVVFVLVGTIAFVKNERNR